MKCFRLLLILFLVQPCPLCMAADFVHQWVEDESSACHCCQACCTSHCRTGECDEKEHSLQTPLKNNPEKGCPCICHTKGMKFAKTRPSNHLKGLSMSLDLKVNDTYGSGKYKTVASSPILRNQLLTVPLRL